MLGYPFFNYQSDPERTMTDPQDREVQYETKTRHGPFVIKTRDCGDFHDVLIEHKDGWYVVITEDGEGSPLGAGYLTIFNPPKLFDIYKEYPNKQIKLKDY